MTFAQLLGAGMRIVRPVSAIVLFVATFLLPRVAPAQQGPPETIRGRVVGDSARAISGASVLITRGPDRLTLPATPDAQGD